MSDNETTADIIAWLRRPREGENAYLTLWRDEIADRFEAALERERGDAAKLREALETARLFVTNCPTPLTTPLVGCGMSRAEVMNIIDAALSAPPRNCDVGTPEEQLKKKRAYCKSQDCRMCPFYGNDPLLCAFRWAQTTYKEGGNDGR